MTPTTTENRDRITKMFEGMQDLLSNLYVRWLDEKEYEDINDYKKVVDAELKKYSMEVTKMNKRPFGFNFTIGNDAVYQIIMKSAAYEWKRVK